MKKYIIRMITLVAFSTVLLSSCSVEYRERHRHDRDHDHDHHDHDRNYYRAH